MGKECNRVVARVNSVLVFFKGGRKEQIHMPRGRNKEESIMRIQAGMRKWRWVESTSQEKTWSWTEKGHLFPKAGPKDQSRVAGVGQGAKGTH